MKVPYYKQEFPWSCFSASVRMVLEYYGIKKEEKDLRTLLRVTPYTGGAWYYVELGLESLDLNFYWSYGFSLEELKELIEKETPIIVSLRFESADEYHFNHTVVVTYMTSEFVTFNDPEKGESITMGVEEFLERWSGRNFIAGHIKRLQ